MERVAGSGVVLHREDCVTIDERAATFARMRPHLEDVAAKILHDREEARDVVSDAGVTLLERGPDAEEAVAPWLVVTTRNRALNRLRDRARAERRPLPCAAAVEDPAAAFLPPQAVSLIADASTALAERDARALHLRVVEQRSYEEIGTLLGTTAARARIVVHRARRRLRSEVVARLAFQHGAAASCTAKLTAAARQGRTNEHPGCRPCTAVADEINALAARAILPLLPALSRPKVLARAGNWLMPRLPLRIPVPAAAVEVAAAALALALSFGETAVPVGDVPPVAASPVAVAATVATPQPRLDRRSPEPPAAAAPTPALAAGEFAAPLASPPHLRHGIVYDDRRGDQDGLRERVRPLPTIVTDALGDAGGRVDISRFEVVTVTAEDGSPRALLLRLTLAQPIASGQAARFLWRYPASSCSGQVWVAQDGDARAPDGSLRASSYYADYSDGCQPTLQEAAVSEPTLRLRPRVAAEIIEVEVPFALVAARKTNRLVPGAELIEVMATVTDTSTARFGDVDNVPDTGGFAYRVGE